MQLRITSTHGSLTKSLRSVVERRLRFAVTRFTPTISDVSVALSDESGPKGAPAKKCRIVARLRPKGHVLVEAVGETFEAAVGLASDRAGRSLSRYLARRRLGRKRECREANRDRGAEISVT